MYYVIVALCSLLLGLGAGFFIWGKTDILGTLRIDRSDPYSNPLLFLELHTSIDDISRRPFVRFDIKDEDLRI